MGQLFERHAAVQNAVHGGRKAADVDIEDVVLRERSIRCPRWDARRGDLECIQDDHRACDATE